MSALNREQVTSVQHWTDQLFSFTTTRTPGFRFLNGQFAMMGLEVDGRPLLRAYSMASANHEENLEFFSIKVPDGPLTSRLQKIREGDIVLVGRKPTGTLIPDNLLPGSRLLLLSTGTGLAPFVSLIKDPDVYEKFETIVLVHGCRQVSELAYGEDVVARLAGRAVRRNAGRQAALLSDRDARAVPQPRPHHRPDHHPQAVRRFGESPLSIDTDRVMLCGSPSMLEDLRLIFEVAGLLRRQPQRARPFRDRKGFRGALSRPLALWTADHSFSGRRLINQAPSPFEAAALSVPDN